MLKVTLNLSDINAGICAHRSAAKFIEKYAADGWHNAPRRGVVMTYGEPEEFMFYVYGDRKHIRVRQMLGAATS